MSGTFRAVLSRCGPERCPLGSLGTGFCPQVPRPEMQGRGTGRRHRSSQSPRQPVRAIQFCSGRVREHVPSGFYPLGVPLEKGDAPLLFASWHRGDEHDTVGRLASAQQDGEKAAGLKMLKENAFRDEPPPGAISICQYWFLGRAAPCLRGHGHAALPGSLCGPRRSSGAQDVRGRDGLCSPPLQLEADGFEALGTLPARHRDLGSPNHCSGRCHPLARVTRFELHLRDKVRFCEASATRITLTA